MKAKILEIRFRQVATAIQPDPEAEKQKFICTIKFIDPYCNNVKRIVKGVAKCNPDDTFDETLGRRIAEGRAKRAMFQKLDASASEMAYLLTEESLKQARRGYRETEHIQELLNKHYNEQQN